MSDLLDRLARSLEGRYSVERELGRGGMAIVFLARDLKHDRPVAIKVLQPELAAAVGAESFLREIQVTARLQHPLILPLHDSGEANGLLYYVMPFVEGESLRDRLHREGQLPVEDAVSIARDVAEALAYAHGKDVVHRDIKPDNILLSSGHAVVADFGIARALEVASGATIRQAELVSGTPAYMSPEQATGGAADGRTDVYSLGCVLYEMLAGGPPFDEPSLQRLLQRILAEPAPPLGTHRPAAGEGLERIVSRCLEKLPADRYGSASALASALSALSTPATGGIPGAAVPRPAGTGVLRVVAVFAGIALPVLALVYALVRLFGLPNWVLGIAAVLAVLGLPALGLAARMDARGGAGRAADGDRAAGPARGGMLRRAILAGAIAFAALGAATGGYLLSRKTGIGPAASLVSAGVLGERDPILIADFENSTDDPMLAETVKEALSLDLAQSKAVTLVAPSEVVAGLARMELPRDTPLDGELVRELARREGVKAVVTGQVLPAGSGYVLSASLVAAVDGEVLAGFREGASGAEKLIPAIDRLSRRMRERIGESLRSIRADKSLEQATTRSFPALQKYSLAVRAAEYEGEDEKCIELLEEAIRHDSTFAMAHRKLATVLANTGRDPYRAYRAVERAFAHRDRLPDPERYMTEGSYYSFLGEREKARVAYQSLLDLEPENAWALNNLGELSTNLGLREEALNYYRRAADIAPSALVACNIGFAAANLGRYDEALRTFQEVQQTYPGYSTANAGVFMTFAARGDYAQAESVVVTKRDASYVRESAYLQGRVLEAHGSVAAVGGRLREAERYWGESSDSFRRAGAMGPAFESASWPVVARALVLEDLPGARAVLEKMNTGFAIDSLDPPRYPYRQWAMLQAITGDPRTARSILEREEREVPSVFRRNMPIGLREVQGLIALVEQRPLDAIRELSAHRAENPGKALTGLVGLGRAYELAELPDSAVSVYETYLRTPSSTRILEDRFFLGPVLFRLGELYEARGDAARAVDSYGRFTELWKNADPELLDRVRLARARIERLSLDAARG